MTSENKDMLIHLNILHPQRVSTHVFNNLRNYSFVVFSSSTLIMDWTKTSLDWFINYNDLYLKYNEEEDMEVYVPRNTLYFSNEKEERAYLYHVRRIKPLKNIVSLILMLDSGVKFTDKQVSVAQHQCFAKM